MRHDYFGGFDDRPLKDRWGLAGWAAAAGAAVAVLAWWKWWRK